MSEIIELGRIADAEYRIEEYRTLKGKPTRFPSLVLTVFPMSSGPSIPDTEEKYRIFFGN